MSRSLVTLPLALALLAAPPLAAQEKPQAKAEEPVKGLKGRIFDVHHADPDQLFATVRLLGSGVSGAWMTVNRDMKTITARDYPENLAQIEEALKRLDVPGPELSEVDLRIHVLEARKADGTGGELPADLAETVKALRGTLAYKGYRLLTSFTQRVKEGARGVTSSGLLDTEEDPGRSGSRARWPIDWRINQVSVARAVSGPATVKLDGFKIGVSKSEMQTDVGVKEGEQVVVGTSVFGDRGLVVVLSARLVK